MKKRMFSLFIALAFCLTLLPVPVMAAEPDTGLCPHHPAHTAECGYRPPAEGAPCRHEHGPECYAEALVCQHVHNEACGYIASTEGTPCRHEHTDDCYVQVTNCLHVHDESCYSDGALPADGEDKAADACTHACGEETGCITRTLECRHIHDGACGYAAPTEGAPCQHEHTEECFTQALNCQHDHDETCGYVEADPGQPCGYACKVCPVQDMIDALPDEGEITAGNAPEVSAQLDAIDQTRAALPDEERAALDLTRYQAAAAALLALDADKGLCRHHPAHTAECGYIAPAREMPCQHEHTAECYTLGVLPADSGDAAGENLLNCQHVHDGACGYGEADPGQPCGYVCNVCPVQDMIDALPDAGEITADNAPEVSAQLDAIDQARTELADEETDALDLTRYQAAAAALLALEGQAGAEQPMLLEDGVTYLDCDANGRTWTQQTCEYYTLVTNTDTAWNAGWYVVRDTVTINGGVTVYGNVNLILADSCTLSVNSGIRVGEGKSLTIYAQSTGSVMGKLTASGGYDYAAGIGGYNGPSGEITINGGEISATGGLSGAAGIGGGRGGSGGATINGGRVTASGSDGGAGIGGGGGVDSSGTGNVTINGGVVYATGGYLYRHCAAGIGGAVASNGNNLGSTSTGTVTINGENALVVASSLGGGIDHKGQQGGSVQKTKGLVIDGGVGGLYGLTSFTLPENLTIAQNVTLTLSEGQTLSVPEGRTLSVDGKIVCNGTGKVQGTVRVMVDYDFNGGPVEGTTDEDRRRYSTYGSTYSLPEKEPVWEGHTFLGWFTEGNGGTQVTDETQVTSLARHTLHARWKENNALVTVTFSQNEVTYGEPLTITVTAVPADVERADSSWGIASHQIFVNNMGKWPKPIQLTSVDTENQVAKAVIELNNEADWAAWDHFQTGENTLMAESIPIPELNLLGNKSAQVKLTVKNRERTVTLPGTESVTSAGVTLQAATADPSAAGDWVNYGYSTTEGGSPGHWQSSPEFTGLLPDTTYYFYAKLDAQNDKFYGGAISRCVPVTTEKALDALPAEGLCLNDGSITVKRGNGETLLVTHGETIYSIAKGAPIRVTGKTEMTPNTITVSGVDAHIVLSGVNQGGGESWSPPYPITVTDDGNTGTSSNVTLTLEGENMLVVSGDYEQGISVGNGSTLTIEGPGSVKIGNEHTYVGIGIGGSHEPGNIVINSGTVDVTAGDVAIGAYSVYSPEGDAPSITINGGVVKTNVERGYGVGIGTQRAYEGGVDIAITGGSVELSGSGNRISASGSGDYPGYWPPGGPEMSATGSVTITGGSISGVPTENGISPVPKNGNDVELVPVVVQTGENNANTAVDDLGIIGREYGSPTQTDSTGNLTLYLPAGEHTGLAIIEGEVQTIKVPASSENPGTGSMTATGVHLTTPDDTEKKPDIQPDGSIELPGGSQVAKDNTTITVPAGGGAVTPNNESGTITITAPKGSTVQTGNDSPKITIGDQGGTVDGNGSVTVPGGGSVTIPDGENGKTTITVPAGGGTVKPTEDGKVEVPGGSTVKPEGGPEITTGDKGGTVGDDGIVNVPGGGSVTVPDGENGKTTITVPAGGTVKPTEDGGVEVPGGTTVKPAGGPEITTGDKGGTVGGDGTVTVPDGGSVTIPDGENGKTTITVPAGGTVKPTEDGKVEVPGGTTVKPEGGPEITTGGQGGAVGGGGTVTVPDGGSVTISDGEGGKTTITVPEGGGTVKPTEDGKVEVPGSTTVKPQGGPEITTGDKGGTVGGDGTVNVPGGGSVTIPDGENGKTTITVPAGGGTVKPTEDGKVEVPGSTTVKPQGGPEITTGGQGGTVGGDGTVTVPDGGSVTIPDGEGGNITITVPEGGGTVKPTGDGGVEVPGGTTVKPAGGPEITTGDKGGTVGDDGTVNVPGGGKVTITTEDGKPIVATVPDDGGKIQVDNDGNITVPGGATVQTGDGKPITIPDGGGIVTPGGEVEYSATVAFDSQDGSAVSSQTVTVGGKATKPSDPTKSGYTFGGWYKESSCTTVWNFDADTVTGNLTLYAKWTAKPSSDTPSGGSHGGGGGSYTPPTYAPTVEKPSEGGSVSIVPGRPSVGDKVTIQPRPDIGYEVDQVTVTDKNGKPVTVTKKTDGTYTFTQPNGKVNIEVSYQPVEVHWNNPHGDVSEAAWYYDAVRFVSVNGLMNGYGDGRFGPDDDLSRAQLAQILYNHAGRPAAIGTNSFIDVADGAWYANAITWAAAQGIVGGYGDGLFGPNDNITREQLAVMLWRYAGSPAATNKELHFNDADEAGDYALEALRWAVENGILNGYGDGRLNPAGRASRAQVAQMLKNFLEDV